MHTDEYEISLLKEVAVCRRYILALQNTLKQLEKKYNLTSDEVVKKNFGASDPIESRDRVKWLNSYHALVSWEKRKTEYEELHRHMRQ